MDATRHQVTVTAGFTSLISILLLATTFETAQGQSSRRVIPGSAAGTARQAVSYTHLAVPRIWSV